MRVCPNGISIGSFVLAGLMVVNTHKYIGYTKHGTSRHAYRQPALRAAMRANNERNCRRVKSNSFDNCHIYMYIVHGIKLYK